MTDAGSPPSYAGQNAPGDARPADTAPPPSADRRPHVILDTDANNEIDDQHAIAYLLFSSDKWIVDGITTNKTDAGGGIGNHTKEARFVTSLCASDAFVKVYQGAERDYNDIKGSINQDDFEGAEAVNFIIAQANKHTPDDKLLLLPIGKLTNVALALLKAPSIADKIRVVWLGSSYPQAGEYNLENDNPAVNAVLGTNVEFDMATVRFSGKGGTFEVRLNFDRAAPDGRETRAFLPGKGPKVPAIRSELHGGTWQHFGDYSLHILDGTGETSRSLFDVAALAVVKNPAWATAVTIGAPLLRGDNSWEMRPNNARKIRYFENFNQRAILDDFRAVLTSPKLPN